ncbi:MAG: Lrp/AsnC family transcriptional regulator [Lachnospiraceae bacterium]|nr:Lrp/AsnC family transcriptional regulator [Lachnospiraceae bacterium]
MDEKDEQILDIMKGNARISFQELGEKSGISRVAAMKRVRKLEEAGIIRGYNTCIYLDNEITVFMDIYTKPDKFDKVLEYITTGTVFIRQIFITTGECHIHFVAVAPSLEDMNYLIKSIEKKCGRDCVQMSTQAVKQVVKDVYGGVR